MNHKVYRIGQLDSIDKSGSTEFDIAEKSINPLGSWVRYGNVKNDFVMLKSVTPFVSVLGYKLMLS
jgi:large subunit ribosomal protein L3e